MKQVLESKLNELHSRLDHVLGAIAVVEEMIAEADAGAEEPPPEFGGPEQKVKPWWVNDTGSTEVPVEFQQTPMTPRKLYCTPSGPDYCAHTTHCGVCPERVAPEMLPVSYDAELDA